MIGPAQLLELLLNGLTIGIVYVLVAAGLSVVFGVMNVLNVSHGELLALGGYFAFSLVALSGESGFWLSLVLVPVAVGLLGAGIERLTIQRVYGRGHLSHILLTFGLLLILYDLRRQLWGDEPRFLSTPAIMDQPLVVLGFSYPVYNYFMLLAGGALAVVTWLLLRNTKYGLIVRAGAEDRGMVRNLGIDIDRYYTRVFGFGAALAAFGGIVLGGYQSLNPEMGNAVIIPAFVIVVLGGLGSFRGAVVGGLVVGIIQSVVSTYLPAFQGMVIFLLMIGVLLVRPQGLFGGGGEGVAVGSSDASAFVSGRERRVLTGRLRPRLAAAVVGALALVPVFEGVLYSRFVTTLLITVLIWALFAMSLDIVLGYTGLISLGHTLFYGLGAYVLLLALIHLTPSAPLAVGVAVLAAAGAAWVVGRVAIRVSGVYFVMITLAFAEVVHRASFRLDATGGSNGLFGAPEPLYGIGDTGIRFSEVAIGVEPFTFTGDALFYYLLLGTVVAAYLLVRRLMAAPFGTVLQSIRENETRSRFVGYRVQSFKRQAFVLSGTLAGLAGALFGLHTGFASPSLLHWINSGEVIVMAILGGSGTLYGPMLGAAVFTLFEEYLSALVPWWRLILGAVFVLVVLFLPRGLISLPARVVAAAERHRGRSAGDTEPAPGGERE